MNSKKILAAAVSEAAIASLTACGGVKDDTAAGADSGNAITIGTTDKITSLDPAGSYDNGSYAVQIQVFPFLYAQDYNTSELSPDIAADDGTWNDDGTEFTVKLKDGLKFANGNDLTAADVKFSYDRIKKINDPNGPSSLLANVESVTAKDDTTVVFKDSVPFDVTLKQVMSSPAAPIVDEDTFDADTLTDADTNVSNNASNSNREARLVRSDNFCKTRIRAAVGRTPFPTNISSHCFVDMSYLSYLITIQKYEQFPNIHSSKKDVRVFQNSRTCFRKKTYVFFSPHILIFSYFAKRLSLNRLR